MRPIRVLLIAPKNASGTGGGTYSGLLTSSLKNVSELETRVFSSPSDLDEKWDAVHVLDLKHFDPRLASQIEAPLILDVHDAYWTQDNWFFPTPDFPARYILSLRRARRYAPMLNKADATIVHSKNVADKLKRRDAFVVPCAIEPLEPGPPLSERPPNVLFAGRDYFRKGISVLLSAWRRVHAVRPDAELIIAGREYVHGRMYARLRGRGLNVKISGDVPRETLLEQMRQARAVALPSWDEAFGITLVEAMASGAVAVATRVGGMPEVLDDGRVGLLVERGDSVGLSKALLRCLAPQPDAELLKMIVLAREKAATVYSMEKLVEAVLQVYEKVVRKE